jgi:hypothetical protein
LNSKTKRVALIFLRKQKIVIAAEK